MSSPCEMAPFGHSGSHAPQLMHSSVMKVAIRFSCRYVRDAGSIQRRTPRPVYTGGASGEQLRLCGCSAAAYAATQQSTGQTEAHAGESCWPLHSVHFEASIT